MVRESRSFVFQKHPIMTYTTDGLLGQLEEQTEKLLVLATENWQMLPPACFAAQPVPGSWSAAQCLEHLNGYGDYYLPLLTQAIRQAEAQKLFSKTFSPGMLGNYFTRLMEPAADGRPAKKMKTFRKHDPLPDIDPDKAIARFISQQETLLALLESAKGLDLGRPCIPVSIAPFLRLKTGDTFRFIVAHNRRHSAQAQRALMMVGKVSPKLFIPAPKKSSVLR